MFIQLSLLMVEFMFPYYAARFLYILISPTDSQKAGGCSDTGRAMGTAFSDRSEQQYPQKQYKSVQNCNKVRNDQATLFTGTLSRRSTMQMGRRSWSRPWITTLTASRRCRGTGTQKRTSSHQAGNQSMKRDFRSRRRR